VAVDTSGFVYVAGETFSANLATVGAFQTNFAGGSFNGDAFVAKFSNDGSNLVYCTYLGGSQDDLASSLAVDEAGDVFLTGYTDSPDFPTTNALYPKILGRAYYTYRGYAYYSGNAFAAELNTNGSRLVYSTYLGGSGSVGVAGSVMKAWVSRWIRRAVLMSPVIPVPPIFPSSIRWLINWQARPMLY